MEEEKEYMQPYQDMLKSFIKNNVPKRYNQLKLLKELDNPEIDHFISISNRTDGKSFNYIHALLFIAVKYDIGITFLSRNMMLRTSYQQLIDEIIDVSNLFDRADFNFIRNQYYVALNYKNKTIAIISDLNNAGELKYYSNYIKKFPIIVYDEFLALETDYLSDEWQRLKTIYESIDREAEYPLIKKPKILYFGNAVNFDSPVLHGLQIFNILEKHPMDTAKIYKYKYNIMLEVHRNENANSQRNTRAFASDNDSMTTGEFETNAHNLADDVDRNHIKKNPRQINVKLKSDYLTIRFNRDSLLVNLAIESNVDGGYQFNMQLKDNTDTSQYLKPVYYDDNHIKRIDKGKYLFDNNFSKNYITGDFYELNTLKIHKLVREYLRTDDRNKEVESKEKQFKDNFIEDTKKGLMKQFWG